MSVREEVYKLLALKKNTREIAKTLNISIRCAQKHKRTYDDTLANGEQKTNDRGEQKRRKEIARAHIETGSSIREASEASGISISTALKASSKERLQEKQADFLRRLRDEHKARIEANKCDRLRANEIAKKKIIATIEDAEYISKTLQETLILNEKAEQEILESDRLIQLEKLEFEREKALSDIEKTNEKLDDVLSKLEESL
ncbi:hypothetical protein BSQ88_08975 [Fusobacterium necrophorum subsp. funduliforme]|uniref:hypothetical protein n=1 Tax=Fusobacterium necrophorum TaxID=859 RepID=UPI000788F571|nr:hypothetical protein [Fusobacterium necrophorum]AYV93794.1 hypothetical protein BSQ88_08975 [Fusobacterium necrophorum subsp. funduliforme]KYM45013.1 hypothetical protein A2U05_09610 [Fusobacterium necrophorum subsp. funduliforme]